ncbi:MAG TPA: response regulator [Methanospirillum sp.]|nr:response regulator [Methanospirillum sp.]
MMEKKTILVVDDALIARQIETAFLTKAGFEVIEAINGEDAIQKFIEQKPDITILDILMPQMNGIEALKAIIRIDPEAKVIVCTSVGDYRMADVALQHGASGYVIKPYKGSELIATVNEVLEKKRLIEGGKGFTRD